MKKHPKLSRKLKLLYLLKASPEISNNQQLAVLLGITRQTVSKWCTGSPTQLGDAIPDAHFFRIGELFRIDSYLFTLEYEEFEKEIRMKLDRRNRGRLRRPRQIFNNNLPATGGKLLGRENELAALFEAWNQCKTNVLQITGLGGVGKSSLVNEWLSRMDSENYWGAERVFAWSFHCGFGSGSSGSSSEVFFSRALTLLGDAEGARDDPENQVVRLVQLIRKNRTLLVLDGVQNLQYSYGPNFGQFQDPAFSLLLRELEMENPGLCVLTSRLKNADLEAIGASRAAAIDLEGLDDDAAGNLLRSYEVRGEPSQFAHALRQHEGLPLSLCLLGRHLDLVHDGNLAHYMEPGPLFEECGESERAANLAREYLGRLPLDGQRKFFHLLSLFKRPVKLRELHRVCRYRRIDNLTSDILSLTSQQLRYGIFALEKAGFVRVLRERHDMTLELTKFAEETIALDLKWNLPELWKAGNRMLFERFREKKSNSRPSRRDREVLYRAVMYGARAESWDEAFALYFEQIRERRFFLPSSSSFYLDQACLRTFFPDPWSRVVAGMSSEESKFDLQFCAAVNLANLGDIDQAIDSSLICVKWFLAQRKWAKAVSSACLLLSMFLASGRLPEASRWAKRIRRKLCLGSDPVTRACADMLAANLLFLRGKVEKAGELFRRADLVITAANPQTEVNVPIASYYFCRYLLETGSGARVAGAHTEDVCLERNQFLADLDGQHIQLRQGSLHSGPGLPETGRLRERKAQPE